MVPSTAVPMMPWERSLIARKITSSSWVAEIVWGVSAGM